MRQGKRTIYTLGTSNRTLEEFLEILQVHGIKQVVDVRRFPTSSRYPWFNRETLSKCLEMEGIKYVFMGKELGGYRKGGYRAFTGTQAFQEALITLESLASQRPTAIICAERLPWRCHRLIISKALEDRGWHVVHVLDKERTWNPSQQHSLPFPREEV